MTEQNIQMNVQPDNNSNIADNNETNNNTDTNELLNRQLSISVRSLNNIKQILDICSTRGTFRGEELYAVGITYKEISDLIQAETPTQTEVETEAK